MNYIRWNVRSVPSCSLDESDKGNSRPMFCSQLGNRRAMDIMVSTGQIGLTESQPRVANKKKGSCSKRHGVSFILFLTSRL